MKIGPRHRLTEQRGTALAGTALCFAECLLCHGCKRACGHAWLCHHHADGEVDVRIAAGKTDEGRFESQRKLLRFVPGTNQEEIVAACKDGVHVPELLRTERRQINGEEGVHLPRKRSGLGECHDAFASHRCIRKSLSENEPQVVDVALKRHQSRRAEPASRVGMSQGFKSLRRTDNEIIVVPESGIRIEQVILTVMRHIPVDISACTTLHEDRPAGKNPSSG